MIGEREARAELRKVIDPELGINIVDLGLVYRLETRGPRIEVDFTLTYPGCPVGPQLRKEIVETLSRAAAGAEVEANIVWEPLWGPERMSEEARLSLGYPI